MFTAHAQKRLFRSFRSKTWPCHSLRRHQFPERRVYFHYRMTFAAYIRWFCAQFSFDLFTLAVSDELSFIHPTHIPIFSILISSVPELWVTKSDYITITWNGHCACAVSRDLSPGAKMNYISEIPDPNLSIHFVTPRALQRRLSHVIGVK